MTVELAWSIGLAIATFIASVAVGWAGIRGKLESIPEQFDIKIKGLESTVATLELTIHRRINQTCETCRANTSEVKHSIEKLHERVDDKQDK